MKQISTEEFGSFLTLMRKEKQLTQKELAKQLFVSDKAVSKWERGICMPNVALLSPLANILGLSVEALLQGKKTQKIVSTQEQTISKHPSKKRWRIGYGICVIVTIIELLLLYYLEVELKDVFLMSVLCLIFAGWFCLFAKDLLPTYYDNNKINIVAQGICRIHMVGLSFNNSNWYYICKTLKIWTLSCAMFLPFLCLLLTNFFQEKLWVEIQNGLIGILLVGMLVSVYWVGKKYE